MPTKCSRIVHRYDNIVSKLVEDIEATHPARKVNAFFMLRLCIEIFRGKRPNAFTEICLVTANKGCLHLAVLPAKKCHNTNNDV